ncbi:MAG: hypothetical protein ACM3UY_05315 [Methanocella sp.]
MGRISKTFAVFLTLIIGSSCLTLLIINPANAQSIPKPSVPEFSLKYVDRSYDVPPVYSKDPLTGDTVMTYEGYLVQNYTVDIIIKNQPFTSAKLSDGNVTGLYYSVRSKGHYVDWINNVQQGPFSNFIPASESSSTVITIMLDSYSWNIQSGGKVDFRVCAHIGFMTFVRDPLRSGFYNEGSFEFTGESSDWSPTQTITVGEASTSDTSNPESPITPSPTITSSPTPTPTVPDREAISITLPLDTFVVIVAVIATVIVALSVLSFRSHQKNRKSMQ